MITDEKGNITNISEGLFHDYGLCSKFFGKSGNGAASIGDTNIYSINMAMIAPDIYEQE